LIATIDVNTYREVQQGDLNANIGQVVRVGQLGRDEQSVVKSPCMLATNQNPCHNPNFSLLEVLVIVDIAVT